MVNEKKSNIEKRQFFRADDDIIFDYYILDPNQKLQENNHDPIHLVSQMAQELNRLDLKHLSQLNYVIGNEPKLGEYLAMLNQKIDLLFHFISQDMTAKLSLNAGSQTTTHVNLSAGGIGFHTKEKIEVGTALSMKFLLQPSCDYIAVEGRVVACVDQSTTHIEKPYRVSVEFYHLNALDEQKIVKHIQRLEILALQSKKPLDEQNF